MFGDEECRSEKTKVDEKDFRKNENMAKNKDEKRKYYEMETVLDEKRSHDASNIEKIVNGKMKIDGNDHVPLQMSCDFDGVGYCEVSELEENEESIDLSSLDAESIKLFNEKYSEVKISSRIPSPKNMEFQPSSNALIEQSLDNLGKDLNSKIIFKSKNNSEKTADCSLDECKDVKSSTEVFSHEEQPEINTNSSVEDKSVHSPTSTQSIPLTGFSDLLSSNPMLLGTLVTQNGSVYYQPVQSLNLNTGLTIPHILPDRNYHCYVMAPNRSDPNSSASTPDFLVNPNPIQVPLFTNCATPASSTSMISLDSLQRAYLCMTASNVNNPNSILSLHVNRPTNIIASTNARNENVISLESLQHALSGIMIPSNPNSITTIPVNQSLQHSISGIMVPSNPNSIATIPISQVMVLPTCAGSITSSTSTESIFSSSNIIMSASMDSNKSQGVTSSQFSTCAQANVERIWRAQDQSSSISSMQDSRIFTKGDAYENQVSRSLGLSQLSIHKHGSVDTLCEADDQSSIRNIQDSTPFTTHENKVSKSLGLPELSISTYGTEKMTLDDGDVFSINKTLDSTPGYQVSRSSELLQLSTRTRDHEERLRKEGDLCSVSKSFDFIVSTPADKNLVCKKSSGLSHICATTESTAEADQEASINTPQDCRVSIPVNTKEVRIVPKAEERGRLGKKDEDLSHLEKFGNQAETKQNRKDSSSSHSSSQHKHPAQKNSTFIRVSPRYFETKGCCSPLVRVSKNVSPLRPIRGHIQHYVITHGHDRRLVTEGEQEEETGDKCKMRRPIYLKGTPPQGYRRRLLTSAAKTTTSTNKRKRKKSDVTLEDEIQEQTTLNHKVIEEPESSGLVMSLEDKTPKEAGAPIDLDTKELGTLTPSDPKTTFGYKTPNESCTIVEEDTRNPGAPKRSLILGVSIASQRKKESGISNNPDTQETSDKSGSPKALITSHQETPINIQTLNETSIEKDSVTPKNQKSPNEYRTPNIKIFKTPRTEDKEKKREREHRNCLELRDGFQSLCRLLPGTKRTWSRVTLLNIAIDYITDMQELLKDFETNDSTRQLSMSDKENEYTSEELKCTSDQDTLPASPEHVVPRSLDSHALEEHEYTMEQRLEGQDSTPNVYVVENPTDMQLEENSIYILYPASNTNEGEMTGLYTSTEVNHSRYDLVYSSVDAHCVDCQCVCCNAASEGDRILFSVGEQEIAVRNIEGYRFNESYVRRVPGIVPGGDGRCGFEVQEACEDEGRRPPEVREASESWGRTPPEGREMSGKQDGREEQGPKKQPEIQIEVLGEGSVFGDSEEEANRVSGTNCLEWNTSPRLRSYFPINDLGSPGELQGQGNARVLYTTSPCLPGIISSPVILVPDEYAHLSEIRNDTHDQELPRSPQYGAYGYSNVTRDLSTFVVPQSPEGLSLGGSPSQFQIEDFSQSSNSQESQSTTYGVISEDALNYIGATVSPFATPRLGFLPSFAELSPSQVIPKLTNVQEEPNENNEPNVVVTNVTDFTEVGLISVAASVEIPAGSKEEKTQKKPRKSRIKIALPTKKDSTKKPRKRYKKVKSRVQKQCTTVTSDQDGTDYFSVSPKQTGEILNDYHSFKTPSPRIRRMKRTPEGETSEVIDNESDCVPLCPLPKKRGRKPKKPQNAECKRQLINEEPLSGMGDDEDLSIVPSADFRVLSEVPAKRGRKRTISASFSGSGIRRKKK